LLKQRLENPRENLHLMRGFVTFIVINESNLLKQVQCAFCKGVAGEWEEGDVPVTEHKKHFPRCPFICNLPVGNIPIVREGEEAESRLHEEPLESYGFDVCGPFEAFVSQGMAYANGEQGSSLCFFYSCSRSW